MVFSMPSYGPPRSPGKEIKGSPTSGVWASMHASHKTPPSSPKKGSSDSSNWRSPWPGCPQESKADGQGSFHSFDATLVSDVIMEDAKFTPPKAHSSPRTFSSQPQHDGISNMGHSPAFFPSGVAASSISAFPTIQRTVNSDVVPMDIVELTPPKHQTPSQVRRNIQIEPLQYQRSGNAPFFGAVTHHPHPQPNPRQYPVFQPPQPWSMPNQFSMVPNVARDANVDRLRVGLAARLLSKEMECRTRPAAAFAPQAGSGTAVGMCDAMQVDEDPAQEEEKKWRKTRRGCRAGVGVRKKLEEQRALLLGRDAEGDVEMAAEVNPSRGLGKGRVAVEHQRDQDDAMNVDPAEDEGKPSCHGE